MKNKTCIVIVGPTAVGKTSVAVEIAQQINTQIISADSRQCYKELQIGVAKPSDLQLQQVKHYFINSHSIHEQVNAKVFEEYALQKANDIFKNNNVAVMVGGTGLYIKAFCEGMDDIPEVDSSIKKTIITNYNNDGVEWLRDEVKKIDPVYFVKGEIKNPHRMIRALEVKLSTGKSVLDFHAKEKQERSFKIVKIGLEIPKQELHHKINKRVDELMSSGLPDEVKSLSSFRHLPALQTVGYRELFEYLDKKVSLEDAVEQIKINTRQYAKRQLTWFKKDKEVKWFSSVNPLPDIYKLLRV